MGYGVRFHLEGNKTSLVRLRHEGDIIQSNCCYGEGIVDWQEH